MSVCIAGQDGTAREGLLWLARSAIVRTFPNWGRESTKNINVLHTMGQHFNPLGSALTQELGFLAPIDRYTKCDQARNEEWP